MTAGKILKLEFPSLVDPDNDEINTIIVIGLNRPFITGQFPVYKLKPSAKDVGIITVFVTVNDKHPETI